MFIYMIIMFSMSIFMMNLMFLFYLNSSLMIMEWLIFNIYSVKFSFLMYFDYLSLMFMSLVLLISSMIMMYSIEYMKYEKNLDRFNFLLMLFVFSMIMMVISPSILTILLGWDGLGLISYCLIIYYQNYNSFNSGMLTILCNRIGDIGLLMLICLSVMYGSFNLMIYYMNYLMMFMLMISCFTKSAQMPFCSWLPAAMTAPTPISSLVHSSTLVTAGVYLLIRYNEMLMINNMNYFILIISSLTMMMSGLIANFEFDFKKIIALSTLSQLGLMFSILSLGLYELTFFHLFIHALFKSMMFMCVGSFIHLMNNNQDIRKYSNMIIVSPYLSMLMLMSIFCLCGFPFLAGFYSKDLIMEMIFMSKISIISLFFLIMATIFTVSYSFRMMIYILMLECKFMMINLFESKYLNMSMLMLMIILFFVGNIWLNMIFVDYVVILNFFMKILIINLIMLGMILGFVFFNFNIKYLSLNYFFSSMFYLNYFYKTSYFYPLKYIFMYELIMEKGWMENFMGLFMYKYMYNYYYYMNNNFIVYMKLNMIIMIIVLLIFI
uniref:NADH-ubiquinone oxidoreductase chain 5 n=1 Tax=Rediviva intermixta TaxID=1688786 RepID=A0A172CN99_9HYME|nr:NADH dehydrogenase subunit 5 [Rediviva intermixta]AKS40062.1 NADH dehydrogenase subunit 5 [Rediviva intermixta]